MLLTHLVHCPRHKHGNEVQQLMAPNQLEQCHCSLSLLPQQRATHNQHMNSGGHLPKCICGPGVGTGGLPRQSFNGALPGNSLGRAGMCQMQTETASGGRGSGSAPRAWGAHQWFRGGTGEGNHWATGMQGKGPVAPVVEADLTIPRCKPLSSVFFTTLQPRVF